MAMSRTTLISFLFVCIGVRNVFSVGICSESYAPCTCEESDSGEWHITCDRATIMEVVDVFSKTSPRNLSSFRITFSSSDSGAVVPTEFLADKRVTGLTLRCPEPSHQLIVDPNAFNMSSDSIRSINIAGCDLAQQPDFGFMATFSQLTSLSFVSSYNFTSFKGIPSQSNLYYIAVMGCRGFDLLVESKIALPGLHILYLYNNQLNDDAAARMLNSLAASSLDSLEELRLYDNRLTVIPSLIPSFIKLKQLMMERNELRTITNLSLAFPTNSYLDYLSLGSNSIQTIEPGAFAGNFRNVYLQQNSLTRFEAQVYKHMLETIKQSVYGRLSLYENQFICDCHLAWLIKDNPQYLNYMEGARCANSTSFNDLKPEGFNDCTKEASFLCPSVDGVYADDELCSDHFYMCSNGVPFKTYCPSGLIFNANLAICDWPYEVPGCS